jgi:hypothetical protein
MARRWLILSAAGVLLVGAVLVTTLTGMFGDRTHGVAARTTVSPPAASPTPSATPTPTPHRTARRHRTAAARASAAGTPRSRAAVPARHRSGGGQADPCAHNHHCSVPPAPTLKPDPRPPIPAPTITITGAPAGG